MIPDGMYTAVPIADFESGGNHTAAVAQVREKKTSCYATEPNGSRRFAHRDETAAGGAVDNTPFLVPPLNCWTGSATRLGQSGEGHQ